MGRNHKARFVWNEASVRSALIPVVDGFGRMPSANELTSIGMESLANAICRHGGYYAWSKRLGIEQKGTETHFAQHWERHEYDWLLSLGLTVERQKTRAPFDFLVGGLRVDVKASGDFREYRTPKGGTCSGYFFGGLKGGTTCDVFDLLCTEGDALACRFIIPASEARVHNLTITPASLHGAGKYRRFKDAIEHLTAAKAA